jgi:hypothetical protein
MESFLCENEIRGFILKTISQASAMVELHSSVFWFITRRDVVWNRRFGNTYQSHLQGRNNPEDGNIYLKVSCSYTRLKIP